MALLRSLSRIPSAKVPRRLRRACSDEEELCLTTQDMVNLPRDLCRLRKSQQTSEQKHNQSRILGVRGATLEMGPKKHICISEQSWKLLIRQSSTTSKRSTQLQASSAKASEDTSVASATRSWTSSFHIYSSRSRQVSARRRKTCVCRCGVEQTGATARATVYVGVGVPLEARRFQLVRAVCTLAHKDLVVQGQISSGIEMKALPEDTQGSHVIEVSQNLPSCSHSGILCLRSGHIHLLLTAFAAYN